MSSTRNCHFHHSLCNNMIVSCVTHGQDNDICIAIYLMCFIGLLYLCQGHHRGTTRNIALDSVMRRGEGPDLHTNAQRPQTVNISVLNSVITILNFFSLFILAKCYVVAYSLKWYAVTQELSEVILWSCAAYFSMNKLWWGSFKWYIFV